MPEVILPCPACGDDECLIVIQELPSEEYSVHCGCGHAGRYCATEEEAIKAHNALPRSLTWTYDPPKVEGDCYVRTRPDESEPWDKPFVVNFSESYLKELRATPLMQFAGPIPAPIE